MAANWNLIENANALIDTRNFQYTKVYIIEKCKRISIAKVPKRIPSYDSEGSSSFKVCRKTFLI